MPTSTIPLYLNPSQATAATNNGLKPPAAGSFLMDASMASAESFTSMRDDGDAFLFYDDDDISASSDMTEDSDDDDEEEDSESSEESDSEASLDHEATLMEDADLIKSISTLRAGMQRVRSANSLRSMLSNASSMSLNPSTPADQVKRRMMERSRRKVEKRSNPSNPNGGELQQSISIGNMQVLLQQQAATDQAARKQTLRETSSLGHIGQKVSAQAIAVDDGATKPDDHLTQLLGGTPIEALPFNSDALDGFFLEARPEYVAAWTNEVTKAVRDHDLNTLQQMHQQGMRLQACNQFGESIVHLCVRRGTPEMLSFLLQDAGVSMRVCCENGRTPLHDAAWCLSDNPKSYQVMMILMAESPMMLHITDKRGFTPLSYVPRARWAECNAFLDKQYAKGRLSSRNAQAVN